MQRDSLARRAVPPRYRLSRDRARASIEPQSATRDFTANSREMGPSRHLADRATIASMNAANSHPQRHPIRVEEYLRMGEAGVFSQDARLELMDGEIMDMAPIGIRHAAAVNLLTGWLVRGVGDRAIVSVQNPLIANEWSAPQPDLAVLRPRADRYFHAHPGARDVLLVIEVAETTLRYDLGRKMPLYARTGVAEAWVIDLESCVVHVFRGVESNGYREHLVIPR